jgi:ankyrin repeat protein
VGESVSDAALRERRKGLLGGLSEEDEVSLQTLELVAKLTTLMVECGNDEASAVLGSFVRRRKRLMRESYLQEENAKLPHLLAHSPPPTPGTPYYPGATRENKDEEGGSYSARSSPSPSYNGSGGGSGGGYTHQSTPDSAVSSHTVMTPGPGGTSPYGRSSIAIRIDGATDTVMSTGSPTRRVKQHQQQQESSSSSSSSTVQPIWSSPAAASMPGRFHSTTSVSREADSKVSVTSLRKSVLFADINGGNGGSYEAKAAPGAGPKADLPRELTLKFSQACQAGALSLVQDCLKAPYVLNDDAGKRTLLNCCDEVGNTPLMLAVQSGNETLFDRIIDACEGSARSILDPNIVNMDGDSPLIIASLNKRVDMAKGLLELGADKNLRNKEGLTAGEIAAWNQDKLMGRLLHAEESACAVLVQKVWRGTREWKRFARIVRARKENRLHSRSLRRACLAGTVEAAQQIISLGIDVNEVEPIDEGGDGSTPLLIATVAGQIDMVMVLLTMHNANCSVADLEGLHPFLAACGSGNLALVNMFLNYPKLDRAVLNQADNNGMTPLLAACAHSHFEVVQSMLASPDYGASFSADVKDNNGNTPLHLAVSKRHLGAFRALSNPGINCDRAAVNAHGDSALLLACLHRDQTMVAVLIETATRNDLMLENADGLSVHELVSIPSSPKWLVDMVMAQERAAELIQRVYRCHMHFHSWTGREIRARIGRKIEEDKLSRQCAVATRAQALVRGYLGRKKYSRLRIAAVDRHVQHYAALRLGPPLIRYCRRVHRKNMALRNKAAFLIQQLWQSRSVKKAVTKRRESRKSQHFADIMALELQEELERLDAEYVAYRIAEEGEEEGSGGDEGNAAAESAVRTNEEEEEAEEEDEEVVLSPIEAARSARQRRRSSLSATAAAEPVALLLEKTASTGGSQRNFLNLSSAGQRRASTDMTTLPISYSFSSFPSSESHATMIVPDPKRRATMAPLTGLSRNKALADMAALLPSKEVWEHKKAMEEAKTNHSNPKDGGGAVASEVVGMMALLPEKEAWEHKKDREETARRDSAVASETAKHLNEMMALLPEKEAWEHKKDKNEARRATLMDASAVVLADLMALLPAQEKWEHKQQQRQSSSFASSSAGEAASRRASTGAIPALMALELSMPAREEWETKKTSAPAVATSSLSLLPTDAEKEEMREEESAAAELEPEPELEPESVAVVVNKPEVESVAEEAVAVARPDEEKETEAEPEQPAEPTAAELKKLRLKNAFSAVTTKAHRQHPKGTQKTAATSADAAAAAAAPAKVYSSKHDKVISLIESNVSPTRVLALLKKDHAQGSFRSPTGESLLHTALRLMDPSVHGQGQYKQMHACILHMVELAPASARESNHMGNTPLHLFLARLYAFSPEQQGASASSSSSTFSVLETLDELLYEHPAACTVANRQGDLPLHVAVRTVGSGSNIPDGNKVLLRLLKEHPEAAAHANQARDTALHLALQQGCSLELVKALLAAHPDSLFAAGHGGKYPLRVAYVNNCSVSVVEALLSAGGGDVALKSVGKESSSSSSSAGTKGRGEGSALHMALRYKAPAPVTMATLRFDAEEQCETYDWEGCLPLHVALKAYSANGVSIDLLKEIIAANPAATGVQMMGESPLQYALSRQSNSHKISLPTSVIDLLTAHHPYSDATLADAQSAAQHMREKQEKEQNERKEAQRLDEEHERRMNDALMHQKASLTRRDSLGTMMQRLKSESDAVISSVPKSPRREEGEGGREQLMSLLHTASAAKAQEAKDELDAEEARRQQELAASLEIEKKKLERVHRLQEMEAEIAAKQKEYFEELARITEEHKGDYRQTDRVVETMYGGGNTLATPAGLTGLTQAQTQTHTQQTAGLSRWAGRVKLPQQHQQHLQQSRESRESEKSPAPATRSELFSPEAGPAYSYSSYSSSSSMMGGAEEVVEEEEGSPGSGIGLYRGRSRGMAPVAVAVASSTVAEPAAGRLGGKKMPKSWLPATRSQTRAQAQAPPQAPPRSGNAGLSQAKSPLRDRSALKQTSDTLLGAGLREQVLWRDDDDNDDGT